MATAPRKAIQRGDYRPPAFLIDSIDLQIVLEPQATRVTAELRYHANPAVAPGQPLVLCGEQQREVSLRLNGDDLPADRYQLTENTLCLPHPPASGVLSVTAAIDPAANTALEGLYVSSGVFCTQCEPEGFRRIAFYPDRPDILAVFTVTLIADRARFPVLLANGNRVAQGELPEGRHFATWHDPFPKPSYLFALVAGDLAVLEDSFTTRSGRRIALQIYSTPANLERCHHAMDSLRRAMRWDEERFALEYDLDTFMIFCADDFNMGAMENKGLNIFNSKCLLARPETATDDDFQRVEAVVGHEYFHNWTGNRVTCRDWFQLSLKEGLTVFRDQEFSADLGSRAVERIAAVNALRIHQFPEDAGPMAHSVRPESYVEINNFYTMTVYEKGAEVIRMMHTLLGEAAFQKGMALYFQRFDGMAVTCDDFVQAMQDASGVDLAQFRLWYSQAGTPCLRVRERFEPDQERYVLEVEQICPVTPGQALKRPFHIPLAIGLLAPDGRDYPQRPAGSGGAGRGTQVLSITQRRHEFHFQGLSARPVPSLLRGFSAPVKLEFDYSDADLAFLSSHDSDPVNRWEAAQRLLLRALDRLLLADREGVTPRVDAPVIEAIRALLLDVRGDPALRALAIAPPDFGYVAEQQTTIDVDGIHHAREFLRREIATRLREEFTASYFANRPAGPYRLAQEDVAQRALANASLAYLGAIDDAAARNLALEQFRQADNMTDAQAALTALNDSAGPERTAALVAFHNRWQHEPLVLDKWLALQAVSALPDAVATVKSLLSHPAYDSRNPNRIRALLGSFALRNWLRFHAPSGEGYALLADQILVLDAQNPQVAARLAAAFNHWRRFDARRQNAQKSELEHLLAAPKLSPDVYEIVSKALASAA
ncbi:MAG: aminopeptidase N [Betaproteobacteria bacterium]|nr:aminopeptidase N [Betaproteobacteria bacterium]